MFLRLFFLSILAVGFLCVTVAHGTQVVPATLENMTDLSDAIVVGRVVDKNSYWEDKKIFTSVIVEVSEMVKHAGDESPSSIEIKIPGGKVGDMAFTVDQSPIFSLGEKVMLFLRKVDDTFFPFGFYYGVYQVFWDPEEGKEFISGPLFRESQHYDLRTMEAFQNPKPSRKEELAPFLEEVEALVRQPR